MEEINIVIQYVDVIRTGIIIGLILGTAAGAGGMMIYFSAKMFRIMGGG